MNLHSYTARDNINKKIDIFNNYKINDFELINIEKNKYLMVTGINKNVPIVISLLNNRVFANFLSNLNINVSYLLDVNNYQLIDENDKLINLTDDVKSEIVKIVDKFNNYGGYINELGEHIIDLKTDPVGIHYGVNLLIGDRSNYDHPLQSTPKGCVDYLGRGSFRADSTFQVLATSWGIVPEENGHPTNRQFYLIEDNKQIFYSAKIDEDVLKAICYHSQNHTKIIYKLKCGLEVTRTIFMSRQISNGPCANEIQTIEIKNLLDYERNIKIVYTGMFGSSNPDTQKIDVIYSTLISETRTFLNDNNEIVAITPSYFPEYCRRKIRYCCLKDDNGYANEFCSSYSDFIGNGGIYNPENLINLQNKLSIKGPNFFALGKKLIIKAKDKIYVDTFTGVVDCSNTKNDDDLILFEKELNVLLDKFNNHRLVINELNQIKSNYKKYSSFLQIEEYNNDDFKTYVNNNLPFQVYYQTYISRAFAMTQKGYREIGFREIQDIFASMYYLVSQGKQKLLKELLIQWIENVYKMGYANHNFYYVGKEPGMCSDDQLWLVQAVSRYVNLTGDVSFLNKRVKIAGSNNKRTIYETLKAIIVYSAKISVGKHNLPLLDSADWNDCLKIDVNYLNGPEKEKAYRSQLKKSKEKYGVKFESNYSESVMNAFLLVIAENLLCDLAHIQKDFEYENELKKMLDELKNNINSYCYINKYYARVLVNNSNKNNITYIGSSKDGLSLDENIDGSYYLNSFSWSLLAKMADTEQINEMLDSVEKYLKTPAGFKLCSKHDLSRAGAEGSATDQYFIGDRENGGVFKHATMMCVVGMLQASKEVKDYSTKKRLLDNAYYMLDLVMPYRCIIDSYKYKGNPRFCTQYNNSITEENIGPILSGTSTWLTLAIMESLGFEIKRDGVIFSPALRKEDTNITYSIKSKGYTLRVTINKKKGQLCYNENAKIFIDGVENDGMFVKDFNDTLTHNVVINY